jgi:hypothetical protein
MSLEPFQRFVRRLDTGSGSDDNLLGPILDPFNVVHDDLANYSQSSAERILIVLHLGFCAGAANHCVHCDDAP